MTEPGGSDQKPRTRLPLLALTRAERRAFVLEMVSVIAGILIALGVNEAVQNWHWAEDVTDARAGIHEEIRFDNDWLAYRVMLRPCVEARLAQVRVAVEALAAGRATGPRLLADVPLGGRLDDQNWQALRTSSTFEHFPDQERRRLGEYFSQLSDLREWQKDETQAWRDLSLLNFAPNTIDRSDISRMRIAIKNAEEFGEVIGRNSANQLARAQQIVPAPMLAKARRFARSVALAETECRRIGQRLQDLDPAVRRAQP